MPLRAYHCTPFDARGLVERSSQALGDPEIHIGRNSTAFALPRQLLAQPLRGSGRAPGKNAELHEERLRSTAPATNLPGALRQVAGTLMKEGTPPRVETIAEITGLTARSLQRRLS